MKNRKQSSTSHPILFLMVLSSDHETGATGLSPTVTLSKDGGAFAAASGAVTEVGNGWYALAGNATDRGTLGELAIHATVATADPSDDKYCIVPWDPFDGNLALTGLNGTTAPTAGALLTSGTGAAQIHVDGNGNAYSLDSQGNPLATAYAVANIAVTGAALNATAASNTITTGTETGTFANAATLDGVYDVISSSAGTIDAYYQFSLGSTGQVGTAVTWDGYVGGATNTLKVFAYNWGGSSWDQIGTIQGGAATVNGTLDMELTSAHTGTGGNLGLMRIRFQNTGLTTATLNTDRLLVGYATVLTPPTNWSATLISTDGYSAINWGAIKNPTTTVNLTATTIATGQVIATVTNAVTVGGYSTNEDPATLVLGATASSWNSAGTIGNKINSAGSAGDPWSTALPGAYGSGTAGNIVGNNLNATITSRMATYTQPTGFLAEDFSELDADIEAIQTAVGAIPTSNPSAASIAQAVWQDSTAGDFTVAHSIGKTLFIDNAIPGSAGGLSIVGSAMTLATGSIVTATFGTCDLTATMKASVQTACDAAITANATIIEIETETDGIAAIPTSNPSAVAIATAVWEDLTTGGDFGTANSIGLLLATNINATISSRLATSGYAVPPTTAAIASAVWTDTIAGDFTTVGSPGYILVGANAVETGISLIQAIRGATAALFGVLTTSGANPEVFKNPAGTTTRLTIANDSAGDRTAVTTNL